MFNNIPCQFPKVRGVVWFNEDKRTDESGNHFNWLITETESSRLAYKEATKGDRAILRSVRLNGVQDLVRFVVRRSHPRRDSASDRRIHCRPTLQQCCTHHRRLGTV